MNFLDKYREANCPECGKDLNPNWGRELITKAQPKWHEVSQYYIHRCSNCQTSLKLQNQLVFLIIFISPFIPIWFGYSYVYDHYGQGSSSIFMITTIVFIVFPVSLFAVSKLRLVKRSATKK